jgi:hypothetical protein
MSGAEGEGSLPLPLPVLLLVIPQRSGGICGCPYRPLFLLPGTPRLQPSPPKNKFQIPVTFFITQKHAAKHHIHHANHHNHTTNSPHQNHIKSRNPFK